MDVSNDCAKDYNLGLSRTKQGTNGQLRTEERTSHCITSVRFHTNSLFVWFLKSLHLLVLVEWRLKKSRKRFIIRSHWRQAKTGQDRRGEDWWTVSRLSLSPFFPWRFSKFITIRCCGSIIPVSLERWSKRKLKVSCCSSWFGFVLSLLPQH